MRQNSEQIVLNQDTIFRYCKAWRKARTKIMVIARMLVMLNSKRVKKSRIRSSKDSLPDFGKSNSLNQTVNNPYNYQEGFMLDFVPWSLLHPEGRVKNIWNIIMAVLLLYTAIIMPYSLTFIDSNGMDSWTVIDILLDALFFLDIILNCFTANYDPLGKLIISHKIILWKYAKSWLLLDLVSCFPFSLVNSGNNNNYSSTDYNNIVRLLRLPRLYRLFRIARLFKLFKHYKNSEILQKIEEFLSIKHSIMRLISTSATILLCVHIVACFWFYIAKLEGLNPNTWIGSLNLQDESHLFLYITSVYWAITTLCTVGYGDIHPINNLEKLFSIIWMLVGVYFLSFVIGSLSSMLNSIDSKEKILINKLAIIDEFSKESNLSKKLTTKLRHALRYSTEKTGFSWTDKQHIFNELPKNLRHEVALAMHKGAARSIEFFATKDQVVIASIVPFLQPIFIQSQDFIYKKGEYAEEIYFNVKGKVSYVYGKENTEILIIQKGDYFGDIEVALDTLRKCSAQALRNCELLILNKLGISDIIEEYPRVWDEIKQRAYERDKRNSRVITEVQALRDLKERQKIYGRNDFKIKTMIEKRLKKQQKKEASIQRLLKFYNSENTVEDMYEKLDSICAIFHKIDADISGLAKHFKTKKKPKENNL